MTLYYPSGLYGPICDLQPAAEVEFVLREVILQEPNINLGGDSLPTQQTSTIRPSPKLCRTIKISSLYGGGFGPICDISVGGALGDSYELCPDDFVPPTPSYNPLPPLPPEFNLEIPSIYCEARTIELPTPAGGTETITYYFRCRPSVGDYTGPDPDSYGVTGPPTKRIYQYTHSLICGALNYYSSPGVYRNLIPAGIIAVNIIAFGGGGGAGGYDAAAGPAGSGNNSGGTGSFMYTTVTLDSSKSNELIIVVGGGGPAGRTLHNRPDKTLPGYNRGGFGGHPGPQGISGGGGGGGGATDVYLNNRLIMSVSGGGGGGGHGCKYFKGSTGSPWGNWNNYTFGGSYTTSSEALKVTRYSPLMALQMYEPAIKHSLWSSWFKEYVLWFNAGENTLPGAQLQNKVNLNFATSGNYTFEMQADNQMAVYIAPWYDPSEGSYIGDILYNGPGIDIVTPNNDQILPIDVDGNLVPPSTLPANVVGASNWQFVGYTSNFTNELPYSVTYNISSPGRYVVRFIVENANGVPGESDWLRNPGGMAVVIKNPNGSILWTTKEAFGNNGQDRTTSDGGGAGGGGGNTGRSGLSANGMGLPGGSCENGDSTGQGGSAGWSYVLDHPAITVNYFGQAPSTFHSGWNTPTAKDASIRKGGGGLGGGRPGKFSFIFDGIAYSLYTNAGVPREVVVPGMGNGVWADFMNGKTFQYHYFWGVSKDGGPEDIPSGLADTGGFGYLFFGSYQGAYNSNASQRSSLYRARSLELAFQWTPLKIGNSWSTRIRLMGLPDYGRGTGFADNDILPGVMPPSKSQGTQPWWDILSGASPNWHVLEFPDINDGGKVKSATLPGTSFNFSVRVDDVLGMRDTLPLNGQHGFVRTQYLSVDYEIEGE